MATASSLNSRTCSAPESCRNSPSLKTQENSRTYEVTAPKRPKQDNGKPLPTKYRQLQEGVLIFEPTLVQKAQIALGHRIKISVTQKFQHNPGHIDVSARMDVTEQNQFDPGDKIAPGLEHQIAPNPGKVTHVQGEN